jgi:hypothetical protein
MWKTRKSLTNKATVLVRSSCCMPACMHCDCMMIRASFSKEDNDDDGGGRPVVRAEESDKTVGCI